MTPWRLELFVDLTFNVLVGLFAGTSFKALSSPTVSHRILGTSERQAVLNALGLDPTALRQAFFHKLPFPDP